MSPILPALNKQVAEKATLPVRILQFGEGNFLRACVDWIIHRMNKYHYNIKTTTMQAPTSRRKFLASLGMLAAGCLFPSSALSFNLNGEKLKVALVGVGIRGTSFWGKRLVEQYPGLLEFVGLSDINPGRLQYALSYRGVACPTFIDSDEVLAKTRPDLLIVATTNSTHHEFIIKGLDFGCDVLTEKPLTTDEHKCQAILDTEKHTLTLAPMP